MTDIDIESEEGAQQKADTAQSNAESFAESEVESHRQNETHATAQPPEEHGNDTHDRDFVDEGEAAAAAPVQSVNGQEGDVEVEVGKIDLKVFEQVEDLPDPEELDTPTIAYIESGSLGDDYFGLFQE